MIPWGLTDYAWTNRHRIALKTKKCGKEEMINEILVYLQRNVKTTAQKLWLLFIQKACIHPH